MGSSVLRDMVGVYFGADFGNSSAISAPALLEGGSSGFDSADANTKTPQVLVNDVNSSGTVKRGTTGSGNGYVPIAVGNVVIKVDSTGVSGTFASFVGGVTVKPAASGKVAIASGSSNVIGTVLYNDGTYAFILVKTGIYNLATIS